MVGEPAVIEIAAPNDNAMSGEEAMDGVALSIGAFANGVRGGVANCLYYRFEEESGYENGYYFRRRLALLDDELTIAAREFIRGWIESGAIDNQSISIADGDFKVVVEKRTWKQVRSTTLGPVCRRRRTR